MSQPHAPGPTYQEILDTDTHDVPVSLRLRSAENLDTSDIGVERYFSPAIHDLEREHIWTRTWLLACRADMIPEVGDTHVFDIVDLSILLVRVAPDQIKAFYNSCLHRGRRLRSEPGQVPDLLCSFHGFCWHLDGTMKRLPSAWDFPQIDRDDFALPEVRLAEWGGFVFINMDDDAESFEEFLGDLPAHFEPWKLEDRYTSAYVEKLLPCNWKIAQEAFMESFHVAVTHPQVSTASPDSATQYDEFGTWSRAITARGFPSETLRHAPSEQEILDSMLDRGLDDPQAAELPEGLSAREFVAQMTRERMRRVIGDAADSLSDAELVDSFLYSVFPNFHPWGSYNGLAYRFRPNVNDPETCWMDIWLLRPTTDQPSPPASVRQLGLDDDFTEATELGQFARVYHQDTYNLEDVQRGLRTLMRTRPGVALSRYQETKIRHFHRLYDERMGDV